MKMPNPKNLKIDKVMTYKIRTAMAKATKIKVTINIDSDIVNKLKRISDETSVPYQKLLNKYLREYLEGSTAQESRLNQIEKEIALLKKKVSA